MSTLILYLPPHFVLPRTRSTYIPHSLDSSRLATTTFNRRQGRKLEPANKSAEHLDAQNQSKFHLYSEADRQRSLSQSE
jgi:hypothetical protein